MRRATGAAPLHASRMADKLGLDRVLVPSNAGVGSAVGFLRAPIEPFTVVPDAGHNVQEDNPAGLIDALLEFWSRSTSTGLSRTSGSFGGAVGSDL